MHVGGTSGIFRNLETKRIPRPERSGCSRWQDWFKHRTEDGSHPASRLSLGCQAGCHSGSH